MFVLFYEFTHSTFSLLLAAVSAALAIFAACIIVLCRTRMGLVGFVLSALVFLSTVIGTSVAWTFLRYVATSHQTLERALESRIDELSARALAPGSPFACLDPSIGESIQASCEHEVFASPATVATELSYVWSELTLVSDVAAAPAKNAVVERATLSLRQSLEADRFGFLAYLLATRNGCTSAKCPALDVLKDPAHVRLNIVAHTFDHYIANYREAWSKAEDAAAARLVAAPEPNGYPPVLENRKFVDINFPSAASIPPIHIMTSDPGAPGAAGKVSPSGPASVRSRSPPSALPRTQATLSSRLGSATDPVWTPRSPSAAPSSQSRPSPSAPIQLSPVASPAVNSGK